MKYKFKQPFMTHVIPVDAQTAGETLEEIRQRNNGRLLAKDIVEESRPEHAPLHPAFEWDDAVAADRYRETQAKHLIHCIVVEYAPEGEPQRNVRAFHNVEDKQGRHYRDLNSCLSNPDFKQQLLHDAKDDLEQMKQKYSDLQFASRSWRDWFEATESILIEA